MLSVVTLAPHAQGTLHHHPEEQWGVLLDGSAIRVQGDEDGVVSFPAAGAAALLDAVRAQVAREEETMKAIREGRYQGSYGKS